MFYITLFWFLVLLSHRSLAYWRLCVVTGNYLRCFLQEEHNMNVTYEENVTYNSYLRSKGHINANLTNSFRIIRVVVVKFILNVCIESDSDYFLTILHSLST